MVLPGRLDLQTIIAFIVLFPAHLGWVALPIFFVVSGFCIHLTYCAFSQPSLKAFYIRRFFRIYPAYLLALLTCRMIGAVRYLQCAEALEGAPDGIFANTLVKGEGCEVTALGIRHSENCASG